MAVYTNDLRLKEIATGDESGTWGTSTNTNLSLIADAFGFGTEAITTNADVHTTTIADGSADPGRSIFLKYTGTLDSACTITIGPNTVSKLWLIENATSGSQNIIIKQGSGATVTIANGQTKAIYSDGAGSGAAMVDAFQDLSIPDLFIDDDLTFTSDSAVITFGADGDTTLTHTDGSGLTLNSTNKLMFNDASQFIQGSSATVLSLGATDEIDLTATLIDINGNADVSGTVTATGTSVFASLDISGDIDVDGTTNLDVVDIDGAVDMASTLQVDGAITSSAGATITLPDNNVNLNLVCTDTDGSSGPILDLTRDAGDSPSDDDIMGTIRFRNDDSDLNMTSYVLVQALVQDVTSGTEDGRLKFIVMSGGSSRNFLDMSGSNAIVVNEDSQDIDFRVESDSNTHRIFLDGGNDRVLFGTNTALTTSTTGKLQLSGTDNAGSTFTIGRFSANSAAPGLSFVKSRNGTVGGNTVVADGDNIGAINFHASDGSDTVSMAAKIFAEVDGTPGSNDMPGRLTFFTTADGSDAPTERMRIASTGDVALGSNAITTYSNYKTLTIDHDTTGSIIQLNGADSGHYHLLQNNNGQFIISADQGNTTGNSAIIFNVDGSEVAEFGASESVFNDASADKDFRVESNAVTHALFVDAGNGTVNINTSSGAKEGSAGGIQMQIAQSGAAAAQIFFDGNGADRGYVIGSVTDDFIIFNETSAGVFKERLSISDSEVVFNQESQDIDFRIESDTDDSALKVDAGLSTVRITNNVFGQAPSTGSGEMVHFNSGVQTVSSGGSTTINMFTRTPNATVAATGTAYIACENSGGSVLFGYIIDFFQSNGTLTTTIRESGSSQSTCTPSIQNNGAAISFSLAYAGGIGGNVKFNCAGHAAILSA